MLTDTGKKGGELPGNLYPSVTVLVFNHVYTRFKLYYPLLFLAVLLGYFIYKAAGAPYGDFAGYYFGSAELLHGDYQNVYDAYALNALIAEKGYSGVFVSYAPFPPFTSIVLAPFLLFPVAVAKVVFNIFSAVLFLIALTRAIKYFSIPAWLVWLMPVLFFIPLRNNIFFGQAYLLLFALLLEGYLAYKKGRPVIAALLWAVAIVFKLFPLVILFFLVAKKQYKQVMYCAAACLLLGIVSVLFNGFESWQYYVFTIFPRANSGELNGGYTRVFQSAFMLLKNLLVYDEVQNKQVLFNSLPVFIISMVLFKATILAGCVGIAWHKKATDWLAFASWIAASLLLSPNGSSYSLILLLMPLLAIADLEKTNHKPMYIYIGAALVFLICSIPVQTLAGWPLLLQFPRLYLLLLFFFLMIKATGERLPVKPFMAFFIVLLLADAGKLIARTDDSTYLLRSSLPLVYKFDIKDNRLVYYYWNDSGSHETVTDYPVQQGTTDGVRIQNNQVYYRDKQLTATPDRKKQAMLIDGKYIVYLSDKNRGFGFYTLRRITCE
jgi:hypothetical protein